MRPQGDWTGIPGSTRKCRNLALRMRPSTGDNVIVLIEDVKIPADRRGITVNVNDLLDMAARIAAMRMVVPDEV